MPFWLIAVCAIAAVVFFTQGGKPVNQPAGPQIQTTLPSKSDKNSNDAAFAETSQPDPLTPPQTKAIKVAEAGLPLYMSIAEGPQAPGYIARKLRPYFSYACVETTELNTQRSRPHISPGTMKVLPPSSIDSSTSQADIVVVTLRYHSIATNGRPLTWDTPFYVQVANIAGERKISGFAPVATGLESVSCGEGIPA